MAVIDLIAIYRKICLPVMDVNFNKYSNVSFLTVVCTVFIFSKNHLQVLNRSSKAGAALVKTITSLNIILVNVRVFFYVFVSAILCQFTV